MRIALVLCCLFLGCAGKVDADTGDASLDDVGGSESGTTVEGGVPDVTGTETHPTPANPCDLVDPLYPPISCTPSAGGAVPCTTTTKVASCPTDTACMATVKQSLPTTTHRISRLRFWRPSALLSLTGIAFDPNINPRCQNDGTEGFSWLLKLDRATNTLTTGSSHPSTDGRTFALVDETIDASKLEAVCPGFTAPSIRIQPAKVLVTPSGTGFSANIPSLNVASYDLSGVPIVLPLRELAMRVPSMPDPSCIGSWNRSYWCDGDFLGWTTGGSIVAKISVADADNVPVKNAGCQSLCAILVNDSTKTAGKRCRRSADGSLPEIGDTCVGGTGCKNAFLLSTTFGAYGVSPI